MIKIIHRRDPAGITQPTVYEVEKNTNVLDWLGATFESQNDLCGELACSFFLNEKEIFRNDHESVNNLLLDFTLGENDQLVIINRPAGLEAGAIMGIISVVLSVATAAYSFFNQPKLPGEEQAAHESPNNRLNAASNEFRPGQGIPECFGTGVSYGDFVQPSYYFYENNLKKVVGLFCNSAGEIIVDELRVGDTDINDIPQSTFDVFLPGTKPDDEFLVIHQSTPNVDGQTLVAPDDESVSQVVDAVVVSQPAALQRDFTVTAKIIGDLSLEVGGYLYVRSATVNGVFPIIDITGGVVTVTATFLFVSPIDFTSFGRGDPTGVIGAGLDGDLDLWIGYFDTPGEQAEEVFVHWQAPTGVRDKEGGTITLAVRIEIENVDTAQVFVKDDAMTENTFDPQFVTTRFTKGEFPGMTPGQYKVRMRRITNTIDTTGAASELLKAEAFVSVTPYSVVDFGDATTILVQRKATLLSSDQSGKKINIDYRRKLPFYNRGTDTYETGNLQPTSDFADAVAYTLIIKGNETEATVNLAELYAIQDGLSDQQLGGFTFTFDDANLSKGERVESICNVARVTSFHDGQQWRFSRDEAKPVRSAMFNRRSVTGNNAKQAWQPQRDDDADSVRVIYVDPESNTEEYIDRRFDTGTGSIISGEIGVIPIEIKLAGCRNAFQASNRADLEIRRVAYQRRSVKETTYRDALELELLDRVGWVDINDLDTFDGEVMGINGDDYDTTERFLPEMGKSYVVFLTDDEGYPTNTVPCEPRLDTEFGFIAVGITGAYVASGNQQVGSRYFIADADDLASSNFTLKSRTPSADGTVEIELVEYNPAMYEKDGADAPQDAPILNNGLVALNVGQVGSGSISSFTLKDDGEIDLNGKAALWYSGGVTAGIGDAFEVFAEVVSGSVSSGPLNTWFPLSSGATWTTLRFSIEGAGITEGELKLTIREIEHTGNSVSNNITIQSVIADPVFLPATIDIDIIAPVNQGQARLDFLSNGELRGSDGDVGFYTTVVDSIGEYYELKATNLVGTLDLGVVDVWLPLGGSGATYILTADVDEVVTFDVEIREIADVLNTASSAVTLTVDFPQFGDGVVMDYDTKLN